MLLDRKELLSLRGMFLYDPEKASTIVPLLAGGPKVSEAMTESFVLRVDFRFVSLLGWCCISQHIHPDVFMSFRSSISVYTPKKENSFIAAPTAKFFRPQQVFLFFSETANPPK